MNPTDLPDLSKPIFVEIKPRENQNLEVNIFELTRKILTTIQMFVIFDKNLGIYTVFYKESESEIKKCKILEPGRKIWEKTNVKSLFSIFPSFS